ncbi:MAG: Clp protease N-terminal domain-containing protein, partial [Myxococcota bacterium]|nr:Clp protease N-terminal domain-containing protein [Myxococcota bacterium]
MISPELQVAIDLAQHEAYNRRHAIVTLEHLLYALLHDPETSDVLQNSGADIAALKTELDAYLDQNMEETPEDEF